MYEGDREVMTDALSTLGLNKNLLDNLSDDVINQLFTLIGWAANVEIKVIEDDEKED